MNQAALGKNGKRGGFTLIELLIVVAIIAILAAIAVPDFLEAQVRSKVSRVRVDLRTIATGLEAYVSDHNHYPPNDGVFNIVPIQLTTPVAYLTNARLIDPFSEKEVHPVYGELARYYTYTAVLRLRSILELTAIHPPPPIEGVDYPGFNDGEFERCGPWRTLSNGPDRTYSYPGVPAGPFNPNPMVEGGSDIPYDPTNGTTSRGNILRTQKNPEGIVVSP